MAVNIFNAVLFSSCSFQFLINELKTFKYSLFTTDECTSNFPRLSTSPFAVGDSMALLIRVCLIVSVNILQNVDMVLLVRFEKLKSSAENLMVELARKLRNFKNIGGNSRQSDSQLWAELYIHRLMRKF